MIPRPRKPAILGLAALVFMAVAGCTHGNAREHLRITRLQEIALHPGVNKVEMLVPDGRAGMIVEGIDQDALGRRSTVYLVMLPDEAGTGWNVVSTGDATPALSADGINSGVRFARGWLDGSPESFLFVATRAPDRAGQTGPCRYTIDTYRLATGRTGMAPSGFERVARNRSEVDYPSAEAALGGEVGLR